MPEPKPQPQKILRPRGEPFVWFTGLGLSVGVILIAGLLLVIVRNGLAVFWPAPVHTIRLIGDSSAGPTGGKTFAGSVTLKRLKRLQDPSGTGHATEFQFFTGNKEVYGQMYHFVDTTQIVPGADGGPMLEPAPGIVQLERSEFGDAVGYPEAILREDGSRVDAVDPGFRELLFSSIDESNQRRKDYTRIEKKQIGRINRQMESIRLDQRHFRERLGKEAAAADDGMRDSLLRMEQLQLEYDALAAQARALREQQDERRLVLRLATGEERVLPFGTLTLAHFPNEMGLTDKLGFFFTQIGHFVSQPPREANTEGGIFPAIFGTFVMTLIMSVAVMPFGVVAAIYLREYASQGLLVRAVRISVNNLAGVPSIVYGVFGLGFFVYVLGGTIDELFFSKRLPTATFGTGGILWASLTLALMTVPVVIVATEEALAAVPRGMREASLACGASKWQTIQRIVLPASAPGILTGLILAMARGAGEVAPLMLVGVVKLAPSLPVDSEFPFLHLDRKFMHLGFHIYDLGFQSPDSDAAKPMVFATTLLLILLVIALNLGAILIRNHLRRKYQGDTF